MIIDHDHKYIFISVPKTASISMQFSLGYGHDIPEPHLYHQGISSVLTNNPHCADYFKFAMVRNPWARMLSLYKDFTLKRKFQYSGKVKHDTPLFGEFANFEDFCVRIGSSHWMSDIFLQSQFTLLSVNGRIVMDYIGRFENLASDYQSICNKLNITDKPLLHMNEGAYESTDYRKYYTDIARAAIGDLYSIDVQEFNYGF